MLPGFHASVPSSKPKRNKLAYTASHRQALSQRSKTPEPLGSLWLQESQADAHSEASGTFLGHPQRLSAKAAAPAIQRVQQYIRGELDAMKANGAGGGYHSDRIKVFRTALAMVITEFPAIGSVLQWIMQEYDAFILANCAGALHGKAAFGAEYRAVGGGGGSRYFHQFLHPCELYGIVREIQGSLLGEGYQLRTAAGLLPTCWCPTRGLSSRCILCDREVLLGH